MGVRVSFFGDADRVFDNGVDWFVGTDGELQIYQDTAEEEQKTVAEYAKGYWCGVMYDPLPEPPQEEKKEQEEK